MKQKNLVIGVAGGSGSGKSTFCDQLTETIGSERVARLSHDDYYHDLREIGHSQRARVNFDSPASLESNLLAEHLQHLSSGVPVDTPCYDFASHVRLEKTRRVHARPLVLAEGILLLSHSVLRSACDLLIYVHADEEVRYRRRLKRDVEERGRTAESVQRQWHATVQPMYERYVAPSRNHANLIVPMNRRNDEALELVSSYILQRLD